MRSRRKEWLKYLNKCYFVIFREFHKKSIAWIMVNGVRTNCRTWTSSTTVDLFSFCFPSRGCTSVSPSHFPIGTGTLPPPPARGVLIRLTPLKRINTFLLSTSMPLFYTCVLSVLCIYMPLYVGGLMRGGVDYLLLGPFWTRFWFCVGFRATDWVRKEGLKITHLFLFVLWVS